MHSVGGRLCVPAKVELRLSVQLCQLSGVANTSARSSMEFCSPACCSSSLATFCTQSRWLGTVCDKHTKVHSSDRGTLLSLPSVLCQAPEILSCWQTCATWFTQGQLTPSVLLPFNISKPRIHPWCKNARTTSRRHRTKRTITSTDSDP